MKRRVIFALAMVMILMIIGSMALATEKTTNQNGAFVRVSYTCFDKEGNGHSPSLAISNVEVVKTSANKATLKVYFKASCGEDSEHNYDRVSNPMPFYLERKYCTDTMSDYTLFRSVYPDNHSQIKYEVYAYAELNDTGSHTWENGKCKNCPAECNHSGNTNPPTCTQSADCSICGKTLDALGHELVHHEAKAATCTEVGWDAYDACTRCDYTTYAEIPALNHDLENHDAKAATCTEVGWDAYDTCTRCDYTTYAEIPALNHDLENHDAKAATCTEIGWDAYKTCKREGCNYTTYKELPALNHDLEPHAAQAATCTEVGWDAYDTCTRCDYTTYVELPALGHDYSAKKVEPTCTEGGYTKHTCAVCGDSYTDQKVARLGHYYGLWHDNGDATHTASCVRKGCDHQSTVGCHMFEYVLNNATEEDAETIEFCPVCGFRKDMEAMTAVEGAKLVSGKLSKGEIIVREAILPEGDHLISIAFEYAGKLVQPGERMEIALPIVPAEGEAFTLLNPDGTETAVECVSDAETVRVILEYLEEIDAEQIDPEMNLIRILRAG